MNRFITLFIYIMMASGTMVAQDKHLDLSANMSYLSFTPKGDGINADWETINPRHGTQCAGIIASIRNNGVGTVGVAPDAKIAKILTHTDNAPVQSKEIIQGFTWAAEHAIDILSCSWQSIEDGLIKEAVQKALSEGRGGKGCIIVKSAGNTGKEITFPGTMEGVIAVANMQQDGSLNKTSAHGENLFITAPGTGIRTTDSDGGYYTVTGTSYAAPHVAGVVALMLEIDSTLTYKEVREILAKTAKKIGGYEYDTNKEYGPWNEYYGYGLVDANNAVQMTLQRKEEKSH